MNRSGTSFVTEIDDAVVYDSLINSDEMLATIAVQTQFVNANSRILMIEINDTIQTAVYNMFSKNNFETDTFYGDVLITDLDGNILNALKVEDDYYVAQYLLPENFSVSSNVYSRSSGCPECPEFADCNMCGELGEVVLNSTKKIKVTYIYCHFCTLSQGDQPENESIEAAEWGGGGGNPSACPTGYVKDDNNNCVPQCPEGEEWVESLQQCVSKCDSGFVRDIQGNCVKKPCPKNPIQDPIIAAQALSGKEGGRQGCTRFGGGCVGLDGRDAFHGGLDLENPFGAPVFAMYDGTVTAVDKEFKKAGWISYLSTNVNGINISIQYFHLQKENRISGQVKAGDIIGYQGDSGNLKSAIEEGKAVSHVHIKIKNNSNILDPEDFIGSLKMDENNPIITNENCN